jgi:hypothetical protein
MDLKFGVTTTKDKVINIENKYCEMVTHFICIDIGVRMTSRKVGVKKKLSLLANQA